MYVRSEVFDFVLKVFSKFQSGCILQYKKKNETATLDHCEVWNFDIGVKPIPECAA